MSPTRGLCLTPTTEDNEFSQYCTTRLGAYFVLDLDRVEEAQSVHLELFVIRYPEACTETKVQFDLVRNGEVVSRIYHPLVIPDSFKELQAKYEFQLQFHGPSRDLEIRLLRNTSFHSEVTGIENRVRSALQTFRRQFPFPSLSLPKEKEN